MTQLTSSHQRGITGHHSRATDLLGDLHLPALPGLAGTAMMTFAPYTPDFLRKKCLETGGSWGKDLKRKKCHQPDDCNIPASLEWSPNSVPHECALLKRTQVPDAKAANEIDHFLNFRPYCHGYFHCLWSGHLISPKFWQSSPDLSPCHWFFLLKSILYKTTRMIFLKHSYDRTKL